MGGMRSSWQHRSAVGSFSALPGNTLISDHAVKLCRVSFYL